MDKYPSVLLKEPQPLVFIIGNVENEPDIHSRLSYSLALAMDDAENETSLPPIQFKSVPMEYSFKEKKPSREFPSFDGILKSNWLSRHTEHLPATVLYLTTFNVDWSPIEWSRREAGIQDKYTKLKNSVSSRESKVILIIVKVGAGSLEKEVIDDRLASLKKHIQSDSKSFYFIPYHDISNQLSASMKKISKSVRENASAYYTCQCKRIRNMEKAMSANRTALDVILTARYNFKLGIFNEFLGQKSNALKCYRVSYDACVSAIEVLDEEWTDQIEAVAEYINFKICSILLQSSSIKDALSHFKIHVSKFMKPYSSPWRHYAWLADQYIIFAQLLDQYKVTDSALDADRSYYYLNAAKYYSKRHAIFENAVDATRSSGSMEERRRKLLHTAELLKSGAYPQPIQTTPSSALVTANDPDVEIILYRGWTLTTSKYVGSIPQPYDKVFHQILPWNEELEAVMKRYYEDHERAVDHGSLILTQLHMALRFIDQHHKRRRLHVEACIAEQYYKLELYRPAFYYYKNITDMLSYDGWMSVAVPLLYLQLDCAFHLGNLEEMFHALLVLYTQEGSTYLDIYKKEQLYRDIFFIINAASMVHLASYDPTSSSTMGYAFKLSSSSSNGSISSSSSSSSTNSTSYVGITKRSDFASAATIDHPASYALPNGFIVHMNQSQLSSSYPPLLPQPSSMTSSAASSSSLVYHPQLFDISTKFHQSNIEIGQTVRMTIIITCLCQQYCTFHEMIVTFCGNSLAIRFYHDPSCGIGDCEGGVDIPSYDHHHDDGIPSSSNMMISYQAQMIFRPGHTTRFTFPVTITPEILHKIQSCIALDSILCIDKIDFLSIHHISSQPSSSYEDNRSASSSTLSVRHEVILSAKIMPDGMNRSRDSQLSVGSATSSSANSTASRPWSIREIMLLFNVPRESLLQVTKPIAHINLVYPIDTVTLLQGPTQRINIIFNTNENELIDARLYLASDYTPMNEDDYLFWYPDLSSTSSSFDKEADIDNVIFYPLQLNSSFQPSQPFILPSTPSHSYVTFPIFIRSELVGQYKLRYRVEYVPRAGLKLSTSKEFETKICFSRPLQVNFNLLSRREAQSGVLRDASLSTILRGDTIMVSSTLSCLDSLDHTIDIIGLELRPNLYLEKASYDKEGNRNSTISLSSSSYDEVIPLSDQSMPHHKPLLFQVLDTSSSLLCHNLLLPQQLSSCHPTDTDSKQGSSGVTLLRGEVYVNSIDIKCLEASYNTSIPISSIISSFTSSSVASSNSYLGEKIKTSIGNIFVNWRLNDRSLLQPFDMISWMKRQGITSAQHHAASSSISWLPAIDRVGIAAIDAAPDDSPVNRSMSITRLCSMVFTIPAVQIVSTPFDVNTKSPRIASQYEAFEIIFTITNKLWSYEKLFVKADETSDAFLITGPSSLYYDVAPKATITLKIICLPLLCGQLALPHVNITWEKNTATIIDVGSKTSPKHIFIKPK